MRVFGRSTIGGLALAAMLTTGCGTLTGAAVGAGTGAAVGYGTGYGAGKGARAAAAGGSWRDIKQSADAALAEARSTTASVIERFRNALGG